VSSAPYSNPTLMIIAGEVSGDIHGGKLVREIKKLNPAIAFFGTGGEQMRAEGVDLIHDLNDLAVLGLVEVIRHYPRIRSIFYEMIECAHQRKPDAVILIDYPGFNIRIAEHLKKLGIPVIYFISPQIWAWGQHRKKVISQRVDKMLVFFDFEKQFYSDTGLDVEFVGHPLVEHLVPEISRESFIASHDLDPDRPLLGLLPGSRKNEIERLLPVMLESAREIYQAMPEVQFVLPVGSAIPRGQLMGIYEQWKESNTVPVTLIDGQVHETMAYSDLVLVASGTATLETACLGTPMIILYKVNVITSLCARLVIKIPYIGLVNVVAGRIVAPEFLQHNARPSKIAACAMEYLSHPETMIDFKNELKRVKQKLGGPGALQRAAQSIMTFLHNRKH